MRSPALTLSLAAFGIISPVKCSHNPKDEDASASEQSHPAPDAIAYARCETYPVGSTLHDLPACSQARIIEDIVCSPTNNEDASTLEEHARCICGSDFFAQKRACHRCIEEEGGISQELLVFYGDIISKAHDEFCAQDPPSDTFANVWLKLVDSTFVEAAEELVDSAFANVLEDFARVKDALETDASDSFGDALDDSLDYSLDAALFFDEDEPSELSADPETAAESSAIPVLLTTDVLFDPNHSCKSLAISQDDAQRLEKALKEDEDSPERAELLDALARLQDGTGDDATVDENAASKLVATGRGLQGNSGSKFRHCFQGVENGQAVEIMIEGEGSYSGRIITGQHSNIEDQNAGFSARVSASVLMGCALAAGLTGAL